MAQFEVHDNELFIRVSDGRVLSRELAWLDKVGSQLVHMVVEQFLSRPLIRLPVRLDITGAAPQGDESRLNLDHVCIEPESVRLSLRLIHDLVPPPPTFADVVIAGARPRAIRLTRKAAAAAHAGHPDEARSLVREALEADNSYAMGWLWLAALAEQPADRRFCLERVVANRPRKHCRQRGTGAHHRCSIGCDTVRPSHRQSVSGTWIACPRDMRRTQ